ncbi:MAG TPA: hypothetical protein VF538_12665 [Pyrinomonadaceae bacterium]|jgi:hypothetical protein
MLWQRPYPSRRALDALESLSEPSVACPLPDSTRVGLSSWALPISPEAVAAAYRGEDAPVPPRAVLRDEGEGILVVEGLFRTSAIFISPDEEGSVYTITHGPSLVIKGAGKAPSGSAFCRVTPALFDADPQGRSIACEAVIGGALWSVMVSSSEDTHSPATGVLAKARLVDLLRQGISDESEPDESDDWGESDEPDAGVQGLGGAAKVERREDGAIVATVEAEQGRIVIEAFHTDPAALWMPLLKQSARATCKLSTSKGSPPSRPTLTGSGFQGGETILISFDDAPLTKAKAEPSGDFKKAVTIPPAAPPGPHTVKASGQESGLVGEAPFRVLPPGKKRPSS